MIYVLLAGFAPICFVAIIWAIGVACQGQVHDHEEICRGYYEWEEPTDE